MVEAVKDARDALANAAGFRITKVAINGRKNLSQDEVLAIGAEVDEGGAGLSQAGQTVLDVWAKLDAGAIADRAEAFDEADRRVREQQQAAAEE